MFKKLFAGVLPALMLMLAVAMPASGQEKLTAGTWTGTVLTPEGDLIDVSYEVSYEDEALSIMLVLPPELGMTDLAAEEPMLEEGTLVFTLNVGAIVDCALVGNDEGVFEGECIDEMGEGGILTMMPPSSR